MYGQALKWGLSALKVLFWACLHFSGQKFGGLSLPPRATALSCFIKLSMLSAPKSPPPPPQHTHLKHTQYP